MKRTLLTLLILILFTVPVAAGDVYLPLIQRAPAPTPTPTATPTATATVASYLVVNVVDGDTIDVMIAGTIYRVRYIGIDTPELSPLECYGPEAKARNEELVLGQIVTMEKDVSETDRYGRLLRYVYQDAAFVNAELVRPTPPGHGTSRCSRPRPKTPPGACGVPVMATAPLPPPPQSAT